MIYCANCGRPNADTYRFCENCGEALIVPPAASEDAETARHIPASPDDAETVARRSDFLDDETAAAPAILPGDEETIASRSTLASADPGGAHPSGADEAETVVRRPGSPEDAAETEYRRPPPPAATSWPPLATPPPPSPPGYAPPPVPPSTPPVYTPPASEPRPAPRRRNRGLVLGGIGCALLLALLCGVGAVALALAGGPGRVFNPATATVPATATGTTAPATATSAPASPTSAPATATSAPASPTRAPATPTLAPPTATSAPPTSAATTDPRPAQYRAFRAAFVAEHNQIVASINGADRAISDAVARFNRGDSTGGFNDVILAMTNLLNETTAPLDRIAQLPTPEDPAKQRYLRAMRSLRSLAQDRLTASQNRNTTAFNATIQPWQAAENEIEATLRDFAELDRRYGI